MPTPKPINNRLPPSVPFYAFVGKRSIIVLNSKKINTMIGPTQPPFYMPIVSRQKALHTQIPSRHRPPTPPKHIAHHHPFSCKKMYFITLKHKLVSTNVAVPSDLNSLFNVILTTQTGHRQVHESNQKPSKDRVAPRMSITIDAAPSLFFWRHPQVKIG
ncbi:hypothetical protein [Roseobacter fucihabitans]|uniref:hypothetical protein n=1 Tax=Roseobacter fucihabitans TaxID=1537242 RepID=UPI001652BF60|nr:hypothetical protein [Roseobacter litoralis]